MLMRSKLDGALASGWFGLGLTDAIRTRLGDLAVVTAYPTGTVILREGSQVDALGIVVDGRVAVRLAVPGRGSTTILTVDPGDLIGWSAIVPPYRSTSTVVALEATTIIAFAGPALRAALDADPVFAAAVLPRVLQTVARRLTATRTQLLDLFARSETEPW